ncbi:hypothetical protein KJ359_002084 [Pestalotiopsis sp. 9143b]|nr:hypothetical protein KJ359_002084 [Pestalotiopsis sp. 9143b]
MPLDNIARVRRDEAAARDRELADEERQQEEDAARRLAILRGEQPLPLAPPKSEDREARSDERHRDRDRGRDRDAPGGHGRERKRRKRHGEDDTDFEMRVAREMTSGTARPRGDDQGSAVAGAVVPHKSSDAPLTDASGHVDLFGEAGSAIPDKRKNPEVEAEKARKKRELEDQYRMRFSNAAGNQASASGPWYAPTSSTRGPAQNPDGSETKEDQGTDAFGRPDPGRKDRDAARVEANDPLAMMKRGAAKVRQVEQERKTANEEREKELRRLRREERRSEKRRRRRDDHGGGESDGLEGFSLDQPKERGNDRRHEHRHRHHHHHHRHRSPHRTSRSERDERRHHDRDHTR